MGVPSKVHDILLVQIQSEEMLAATSERNLASGLVTGCGEAKGVGYWAATAHRPKKQGNACREKGLPGGPLGQGHIHRTKRQVKDGNKTGLISYHENDREVLLKSRLRENLESCSVRRLIAASGRMWL
jgi:hypothetical protein